MTRSRGTPPDSRIDRDWPHQVALPDDICCQPNFAMLLDWFRQRGTAMMVRRVQALWPDRRYENFRIHCFCERSEAEAFMAHFGGRWFDPAKDREGRRSAGVWRQTGEYVQMTESGPLRLHPSFMRNAGNLEYD